MSAARDHEVKVLERGVVLLDPTILPLLRDLLEDLESQRDFPYGPAVNGDLRVAALSACKVLCKGDERRAKTLGKLIVQELGYMPVAAAVALVHASAVNNLVPHVEAPDPS